MGMYTTMVVRVTLKPDTPEAVLNPLRWLLNDDARGENWTQCPCPDDHPFFKLSHHHQIGEDYEGWWSDSRVHLGLPKLNPISTINQNADGSWAVTVRSHCKNYDSQMQEFLRWIDPWVQAQDGEQIGYFRFESEWHWCPVRKGTGFDYKTELGSYTTGEDPLEQ